MSDSFQMSMLKCNLVMLGRGKSDSTGQLFRVVTVVGTVQVEKNVILIGLLIAADSSRSQLESINMLYNQTDIN